MARIPQETIEQIAAANDIVEVIGNYFPLKRAGATWKAICPFHSERSPSFTVNPHRQIFKCFGCGAGGSVFRFVMDYEHIDFATAAKRLADRAGIRIVEAELSAEDKERVTMRRRLLALHAEAADWYHAHLLKKPSAKIARDYLKSRGITAEIAKAWRIGYAPDAWEALSTWARSRGFSHEEIVASGLVKLRDEDRPQGEFYHRFRGRVMFPICNDLGEVIAFSGRVLTPDPKAAKYVNSPETALFTKGAVLFGLHKSKRALIDRGSAIVCEGQLDLITAFENGVTNVIAPQGTAFTEKQARILKRLLPDGEVVLCFDSDAAGEKAAERSLASLLAEGLAVRVVSMPPGEDPDSLIRGQGAQAFLDRITGAKDFFDFQLERLRGRADFAAPRGRAQAARKMGGWVGLIGDAVLREAVMNRVTQRLEISLPEFAKLLSKPVAPRESESEGNAPIEPTQLDPTVRLLALVALHDAEARAWLLAAPWRELLVREPDAALAVKILEGDIRPDDAASLNAFLVTLDAADEAAVIDLIEEGPRPNALHVANDCWTRYLVRRQIRRRIDAIQARLRTPDLSADEVLRLNTEVIDLKQRIP